PVHRAPEGWNQQDDRRVGKQRRELEPGPGRQLTEDQRKGQACQQQATVQSMPIIAAGAHATSNISASRYLRARSGTNPGVTLPPESQAIPQDAVRGG